MPNKYIDIGKNNYIAIYIYWVKLPIILQYIGFIVLLYVTQNTQNSTQCMQPSIQLHIIKSISKICNHQHINTLHLS